MNISQRENSDVTDRLPEFLHATNYIIIMFAIHTYPIEIEHAES